MIVAFDLSLLCTGYSIFEDDGQLVEVGHIETERDQSTPLRLKEIGKELKKIKNKYKPNKVLIERGFYRFAQSSEQIFRVNGITNFIFCDVEQIEIHATSVRKTVEGHGNINKDQLRKFIEEKYPEIKFSNYDEVDSFALGLCYFIKEGIVKQ